MAPRDIAIRLATALVAGAVIGFERQWRQRMAGLRTNALVSIGAAGFVVFSVTMSGDNSGELASSPDHPRASHEKRLSRPAPPCR